jgi:hypothetical protein
MLPERMVFAAFSSAARTLGQLVRRPSGILWLCACLALVALALAELRLIGDFRVDDAYITFSFSKNLASGNGPIFSHGLRVEGYSNFLWMLLVALGYLFAPRADPYITARFFSLLALGFMAVAVYRLVRRYTRPLAALLAVALLFSCSDLFRAAMSGLETASFCAAVLGGWYAYLSEPTGSRKWSLCAFLPAALLRIDGFVPLLVALGFEVLSAFNERRFSFKVLARWVLPVVAVWGVYFAWRYAYYGLPLPTTYYAKSLVTANEPDRGVHQLWSFVHDYCLMAIIPLALTPLFWGPRREAAALWTATALQLGYAAHVGGDWMPFNRFLLPVVPLGAILAGWGLDRCFRSVRALRALLAWPLRAGLVALFAVVAVHMYAATTESSEEGQKLALAQHTERHTKQNLIDSADLMKYVIRRPGERLVTDYAGVFSVMTDAHIIDMWGLCNADIALHGGIAGINPIYGKECARCYARLDPEYFHVTVPIVRGPESFQNQREIINDIFQGWAIDRVIGLQRHFVVGRVLERSTGRTLWFLEKRRPGLSYRARTPKPGLVVDYPFG